MRAIVAEEFGGYQNLKLSEIPKPAVSDGRVLVRMTAAGVTPLDHTILSGSFPMAKAPLVLGNEGAGVVEGRGDDQFPDGSRVMFTGPYGVFEHGAFSEWVAVKKEHLCLIPENIGDAAAGLPVAYLTALIALRAAGFQPGKTVLAPAIGGSVGNAVTRWPERWARGMRSQQRPVTQRLQRRRNWASPRLSTSRWKGWRKACAASRRVTGQT